MNTAWWVDDKQLIDEQAQIIDLPLGKSYLIFGPPGSGKTNLLLLRANFVFLAGAQNIQIVVFTRTLEEFIATGGAQYDFPREKVKTSTRFFQDLLFRYGIKLRLPDDFEERRKLLLDEVKKLVNAKKLQHVYDVIFLDEGTTIGLMR
jgi:superfamily I DNA and RNA helicase